MFHIFIMMHSYAKEWTSSIKAKNGGGGKQRWHIGVAGASKCAQTQVSNGRLRIPNTINLKLVYEPDPKSPSDLEHELMGIFLYLGQLWCWIADA